MKLKKKTRFMDRQLLKVYLVIVCSVILTVVFLPMVLANTSEWTQETMAYLNLSVDQGQDTQPAADETKGSVVIIMDDGWATQYTNGFGILKEYGMKANIAVIPSAVDTFGYMTYIQLADLYKNGWDMLNHTYDHVDLSTLSKSQQLEELDRGRQWLSDHMLTKGSDIVVYPNGKFTDDTLQILKDGGYAAGRSLNSVWFAYSDNVAETVEICNLISYIPFDDVKEAINKAIDNHSTIILVLHKIEPITDDSKMQLDEPEFTEIIQYIHDNKASLNVLTMDELVNLEKNNSKE